MANVCAWTMWPTEGTYIHAPIPFTHQRCAGTFHPSPSSSGCAVASDTITGVPQACASMTAIPNPSP